MWFDDMFVFFGWLIFRVCLFHYLSMPTVFPSCWYLSGIHIFWSTLSAIGSEKPKLITILEIAYSIFLYPTVIPQSYCIKSSLDSMTVLATLRLYLSPHNFYKLRRVKSSNSLLSLIFHHVGLYLTNLVLEVRKLNIEYAVVGIISIKTANCYKSKN